MKKMLYAVLTTLFATSTVSLAAGVAPGIKVGTLGVGADVTIGIHQRLNLRLNGNYLTYDYDDTIEDIDYNLDLDFSSGMALLDWHPFANGFRISGGAIMNENSIDLKATPNTSKTIGGHTYTPAQIGNLKGKLDFEDVAPYAGIGFGHAVGENQRLSFVFDLGVLFQSYDVDLSATGPVSQLPQFQSDLREEENEIQDDLDNFEYYPVVAIGIAYKF